MRTCTNCNIKKPDFEFSKLKNGYFKSNCKECRNKQSKLYRAEKKKDGIIYLYYIPEEHYVGITNDLETRMSRHKFNGKITDGYEVIGTFKNLMQAHLYETFLHCIGYNGFRP